MIFNIIPNEVPVEEDGVLGSEFFQDNSVNINYTSKCLGIENHCYPFKSTNTFTISARTVTRFYVSITKTEKSDKITRICQVKYLNNVLKIDNSLINSCKIYNVTDENRVECI